MIRNRFNVIYELPRKPVQSGIYQMRVEVHLKLLDILIVDERFLDTKKLEDTEYDFLEEFNGFWRF